MRNKKNDANGFYLCISDLVVDGVLMCTAGKRYRIQDAESGPGGSTGRSGRILRHLWM